jgi:S-formylglutathione hydrolase FrmB
MKRRAIHWMCLVALLAPIGLLASTGGEATAAPPSWFPNPNAVPGLTFVSQTQLDARLYQLTFYSSALVGPTNPVFGTSPNGETTVRVLLPSGYQNSNKQYPVLYLFHGGLGSYADWTTAGEGNAEAATAGLPMIVVMPDAGIAGLCTNWYNDGAYGTPEWSTYHIDQLVPWIDANYRTIQSRSARATAGLSMGGGCAVSYAARYPDLFGATAAFSGAVDYNNPTGLEALAPIAPFIAGAYATNQVNWRAFNALDLAANLDNTDVSLFIGNGQPGGPNGNSADPTEMFIYQENVALDQRLTQLNIPHYFDNYGPGNHSWYYWDRDFVQWLPHLMGYFALNGDFGFTHQGGWTGAFGFNSNPSSFVYASVGSSYDQYGWSVGVNRPAEEFSALQVNGAGLFGFPGVLSLVGSGTATVVTPPDFQPGRSYEVFSYGSATGASIESVIASNSGQLTLTLALGPGNPYQQYSPQADQYGLTASPPAGAVTNVPFYTEGNGSFFYRTTVLIS